MTITTTAAPFGGRFAFAPVRINSITDPEGFAEALINWQVRVGNTTANLLMLREGDRAVELRLSSGEVLTAPGGGWIYIGRRQPVWVHSSGRVLEHAAVDGFLLSADNPRQRELDEALRAEPAAACPGSGAAVSGKDHSYPTTLPDGSSFRTWACGECERPVPLFTLGEDDEAGEVLFAHPHDPRGRLL